MFFPLAGVRQHVTALLPAGRSQETVRYGFSSMASLQGLPFHEVLFISITVVSIQPSFYKL